MSIDNVETKTYEQILDDLGKLAEDSWKGETGERRKEELIAFLKKMTKDYSEKLGFDELTILRKIESRRDYSAINFYQEANFPTIDDDVLVFETLEDLLKKFPSKQFICPCCKGISTNPYECNSGKKVKLINSKGKKETCNWKAWGLFKSGKQDGLYFTIKDKFLENPRIDNIFKPIELVALQKDKVLS